MPAKSLPAPDGFVYFIRAGRTANVKIGWGLNPYKRLDTLQTGCPHQLHLVGYIPGCRADEQEWHDRWRKQRGRGEWFALDNEMRHAINVRLGQPGATRYLHIATDWRAVRRGEL